MVTGYFWLSDGQWEKIDPLLPVYIRGKRRVDDRRVISGIIQVIISGCRWSDAPLEYGPRKTLYNRFVRWAVRGTGACVHGACARRRPAGRSLAGQHAYQGPPVGQRRAAKKGGSRGIGTSRGGRNTKIHLIADAHGRPKVIALTGGERHDSVPAQAMLARLPPDLRVIADAAYDSAELRRWLADRGSRVMIPNRKNRKQPYPFDAVTYRRRNIVERTFCRLKDFRRLATRYDRLDETFISTLCIAAALAYFLK